MVFDIYFREYLEKFNHLNRDFWNYEDGCVLIGAEAMLEATGEQKYYDCIKNYVDRYVGDDGSINGYELNEYNIDRIPAGRVLFLLYKKTSEEKYRKAIETLMDQLRSHPRTKSGSFWHKKIYPFQIWLDGLYMGMPFYLMYEKEFDSGNKYSDIMGQFGNARLILYDDKKHLYYHAYDEKKEMFWADKITGLSPNFWSRAMGWFLMSLVDCYDIFPQKEVEYRKELAALLQEAIDGMLQYQDKESGLFFQLTALPEVEGNYLETSSSVMIAYALLKGVRLGVLEEKKYRPKGEEILASIETRMFQLNHGQLKLNGICEGAGLGPEDNPLRNGSVEYYLNENVVADEQKGVGVTMMAYSEWLKLKNKDQLKKLGYPIVSIYNGKYKNLPKSEIRF